MQKICVGGVPEHFNLPWHLALENSFFCKEGIDLEWVTCKGGTGQMCEKISNQELDMAVVLTEGAVKNIIEEGRFKVVQVYINTPLIWGIHVGHNSSIHSYIEAFKNNFAISRYGSGSHLMPQVDAHFKQQRIEEKQWRTVKNLEGALAAMEQQRDLVFYWEKFTTKPYVDNNKLKRIGEFITPWPCFVIVASNALIAGHEDVISNVLKVINYTSHQLMDAHNAIEMFIDRYDMLPQDAHQWFHMTEWNTKQRVSEKMLGNVMQILEDCGAIQKQMTYSDLVFNPNRAALI